MSVALEGGLITAVEVAPDAKNPRASSTRRPSRRGLPDEVVGRSITDANVDMVSGSSLTSEGFNAALAQIATDAKA